MSGRDRARQLVADITNEHGFVGERSWEKLGQLDPDLRREFEVAMLRKDEMIGSSVITLAKNLYDSKARFVFELLQNADDNHYENARELGEIPYVFFRVYPKQIIIECNEDGFKSENLRAICNVGKSSKTGAQGYAGEKGIGFKSVFMAAYKVHIQSGYFSFSFTHRKGDSGMGMISPVWEENEDNLPARITRITLCLHEEEDPEAARSQKRIILDQFKDLHEAILLFMKNIQKIDIAIYDDGGEILTTTSHSVDRLSDTLVAAKKLTLPNTEMGEVVRYFHITSHEVTDLAKNENRQYSESEEASKAYSRGEIIIAFPLQSPSGPPLLDVQSLFAFLPIRKVGFKFLIQADFVTQASRQDIVITSVRNQRLANGIADAFIKGVLQLCEHHDLQYQWMRYLPDMDGGTAFDDFWKDVIKKIETRLKSAPILRPASLGTLRRIQDLRTYSDREVDRHGNWLFVDILPELYIAPGYKKDLGDLDLLKKRGLRYTSITEILERVKHDLGSPNSRMKTLVDDDWHSRAANLLMLPFEETRKNEIQDMKAMELLPLRNGSWTDIKSGDVYFHKAEGKEIPSDLELNVIDPAAEVVKSRKKLFMCLGVESATVPLIRQKIKQRYCSVDQDSLTPSLSVHHFRFLYLTHHLVDDHDMYDSLRIFSEDEDLIDHISEDLYVPNDDPFGAFELLALTTQGENTAPGYSVLFIHPAYLEDVPNTVNGQTLSWVDWLHKFFHIRQNIRLVNRGGQGLSNICKYVAKHRPHRFLGLLAATWKSEGPVVMQSSGCVSELRNTKVLCRQGRMYPLERTYLATKELERQCLRFMKDDEVFPWLELEASLSSDIHTPEWKQMARELEFGFPLTDLDFALSILRSLVHENDVLECSSLPERIYDLYNYLHAKVLESEHPVDCQEKIRNQFQHYDLFIPSRYVHESSWTNPNQCVWGAPIEMTTKFGLDRLYREYFEQFDRNSSQLPIFFLETLKVPICTWRNVADEIRTLKNSDVVDFERVSSLYGCFDGMNLSESDLSDLKTKFQTEALICSFADEPPTWHTTSQCLWSSATRIPGKTTLNKEYAETQSFFLDILEVQEMTIEMVYDKLKNDVEGISPEELKRDLLEFSSLLASEANTLKPFPILRNKIFPVRSSSGGVVLQDGHCDFAIVDRITLERAFAGEAKFLDFDLNEVRNLQHFIEWAGLGERYLSRGVKEIFSADTTSTRPISTPEREIRRKAHALLRVAVAFGSPRTLHNEKDFYRLLRNLETLETDKISIRLQLHQDGNLIVVEKEHGISVDIHEDSGKLRVFVPRNKRDREACFHSKLPQRFFEWIMTEPASQIRESTSVEGVKIVQSILTAYPYGLSAILDENGIAPVLTLDEEKDYGLDDDDSSNEGEPVGHEDEASDSGYSEGQIGNNSSSSTMHNFTPHRGNESGEVSYITATGRETSSRPTLASTVVRAASLSPARSSTQSSVVGEDDQYLDLLDRTIRAARRAHLPSQGAFDMTGVLAALATLTESVDDGAVFDEPFRLPSTSQLERHRRIGAAGELFVFELLKNLDPISIPVGEANWKSTIRSYVTIHPQYADMLPWGGRETADITYKDVDGALTRLLADNGYMSRLDPELVSQARPFYFIEVKSTTGPCETPFFMSNSQFQRMQNCSQSTPGQPQQLSEVYVVFRVYNLGHDSVGLKILLDPEDLRQRGELVFTPKTWSVVPSVLGA